MLERSKWERELLVFSKLVNTLVFTGNVNDQHPIINEREQKIQGFNSLELYLGRMCVSMGYQSVVIYNPVDGFYCLNGIPQKEDGLKHIENIARTLDSSQNPQSGSVNLVKGGPRDSLFIPNIEDAAHIISLALTSAPVPIAIILRFTSRFTARPDDLDMSERMAFMYLQEGAVNARCNRVRVSSVDMAEDNTVIQNKLLLIADKINDLPAWYYLSHPSLKAIDIPRPDYRLREQIIKGNAGSFPGYREAGEYERSSFLQKFVGATEGFTTEDIVRVFRIAAYNKLNIHSVDKAILLYKHGVQDNPWLKLDASKLREAEKKIKERVIGQDDVVKAVVDIVKRSAMGMSGLQHSSASSKPRGILFLAGPTGTGKTELAKALTELIFMDERNMIRFDMSEYRQEQSDQRLLGAPPGYVGYEAGGQLTNAVREHPFSVLLFDEIEKAHPSVLDKFLQILEDGRITDGRGETVYFQDCLIIFTSNLGITIPSPDNPAVRIPNITYEEAKDKQVVREKILAGVQHYFNEEIGRPELLNRIGNNILIFDYIREDSLLPIIKKQVISIAGNLWREKHIQLVLSKAAVADLNNLALQDLPKGQGGRGIGNMIEEMLINPLARYMFDNDIRGGKILQIERIIRKDDTAEIEVTQK